MVSEIALKKVRLHNRLRLLGIPLFLSGLCALGFAVALVHQDKATWHLILWSFGATMTGLATFGNHNENAIAWILKVDPKKRTPEMKSELHEELDYDKAATLASSPTPAIALFITILAVTFQALAGYKIWQVL